MLAVTILGMMSLAIFRFVQSNMIALQLSAGTAADDAQYHGLRDLLTAQWQSLSPLRAGMIGEPFKMGDRERDQLRWSCGAGAALMTRYAAGDFTVTLRLQPETEDADRLVVSSNESRVLAAESAASSGADVALCREITPSSPNLHRQMVDGGSYDVQITGECGRLNLNFLLQGEDPTKLRILRQYLNNKGIDLNDLDVMMDSLLDWVSQNRGLHHLNACPETDDYHPPHAGLLFSIDELKKVCGWEELTSKPGWDQDFTIVGNCGAIDLAWASRDVLRALPGLSDDAVDRFLQLRRGPDGIDGTDDDFQFVATG